MRRVATFRAPMFVVQVSGESVVPSGKLIVLTDYSGTTKEQRYTQWTSIIGTREKKANLRNTPSFANVADFGYHS